MITSGKDFVFSLACRGTCVKYELQQWVIPVGGCICKEQTFHSAQVRMLVLRALTCGDSRAHLAADRHGDFRSLRELTYLRQRLQLQMECSYRRNVGAENVGALLNRRSGIAVTIEHCFSIYTNGHARGWDTSPGKRTKISLLTTPPPRWTPFRSIVKTLCKHRAKWEELRDAPGLGFGDGMRGMEIVDSFEVT